MIALRYRGLRRLIALAVALHGSAVLAQEEADTRDARPYIELRTEATRSDNLLRTPEAQEDGNLYSAGLGFDAQRVSPRLELRGLADLDWVRYPNDTFESEITGYFAGQARFDFVPEVFSWRAEETYGQQLSQPSAIATPDTLENFSYLTTGPSLTLRLGGQVALALDASYSRSDYESLPLDSERYGARLGLVRELAAANTLSLNASGQQVEFVDEGNPDYDTQQFFLEYLGTVGRNEMQLELGYSTVDDGTRRSNGVLARLEATRRISAASTVGINFSRQFSNPDDIFRAGIDWDAGGGGITPAFSLAVADTFEERSAGVSWDFLRGRTRLGLDASHGQERYERSTQANRSSDRLAAQLERRLTRKLTARLIAVHEREEFDTVDFDARNTNAELALDWVAARKLGCSVVYRWFHRTSSDLSDFSERQIGATLFYRPFGR